MGDRPRTVILKKTDSLSSNSNQFPNSSDRDKMSGMPLRPCRDFEPAWPCASLRHAAVVALSPYMHLCCHIQKILSCYRHWLCQTLTIFLLSFPRWSLSLGERMEYDIDAPFRAEGSTVSSVCVDWLCVLLLTALYRKRSFSKGAWEMQEPVGRKITARGGLLL